MLSLSFHNKAMRLSCVQRQKIVPFFITLVLVIAFIVPPAHGRSYHKDSDGVIWARVCAQLKVYEVNLVTGEIRYPSDRDKNENNPQELPTNGCHNSCTRREDV